MDKSKKSCGSKMGKDKKMAKGMKQGKAKEAKPSNKKEAFMAMLAGKKSK